SGCLPARHRNVVPVRYVMEHTICSLCGVRLDKAKHDEPLCTTTSCHSHIFHLDCLKKYEDRLHKCEVCRSHFRIFEVRREQPPKRTRNRSVSPMPDPLPKTEKKKKKRFLRIFKFIRKSTKSGLDNGKCLQEKIEVESIGNPSELSQSDVEVSYDDIDQLERKMHVVAI
ncbi:hypothetical protein PENTCL1PPCAC_29466, partial [Pristionchus entomophagus]